jgi:protein-S-isoprenylcysteine O-methyltransferase Ste14
MEDQTKYFKGIIPPPIVFFTFLFIGFIAHWVFPINFIINKWSIRLFIGIPISILSGLIALNAFKIMKENDTDINYNKPTTKIIIKGSFLFTRNPLFLSLLLAFGSIAVFANSVWLLALLVSLFIIFNFGVVVREEHYLEECFGEEYIQYKKKVRRWI